MNTYQFTIKVLQKIVSKIRNKKTCSIKCWAIQDPEEAEGIISNTLLSGEPCMIARYGANEMNSLINYIGVHSDNRNPLSVIFRKKPQWWWNESILHTMEQNAGFFPATETNMEKYGAMLLKDSEYLDVLGSWLDGEQLIWDKIRDIPKVMLPLLEPFHSTKPWTRWLKGKRVVVVHPFARSIQEQYARKKELFENPEVLPEFASLRIIQAVQSIGGKSDRFSDWFEALNWMKSEMDKGPYDVALIGCGAYGFHLAAHAKRTGHQGIHLGGALQLLFGIRGRRWEQDSLPEIWNLPNGSYLRLINSYWVRPLRDEKPKSAENVEDATYW